MIETPWRRGWRERRLASSGRAGRRARGEIRRIQWAFVKRSWAWILSAVAIGAACTSAAVLMMPGPFARGMVVGAAIVLVFGGLTVVVMQSTGTAPLGMGADAEAWTVGELRPLRRHGWRIANHLALRKGDIDHLLVGPHGVFVIETKWSAHQWRPGTRYFQDAIEQVKRNAHDIRVWRPELRYDSTDLIRPVLFLWGGARTGALKPDGVRVIEGVDVVYGIAAVRAWRQQLLLRPEERELSNEQIASIWNAVMANARQLDEREHLDPAPPSVGHIFAQMIGALLAAMVALVVCQYSFRAVTAGWGWVAIAAAYAMVGVVALRWSRMRIIALGWTTGVGLTSVITLAFWLTS